MPTFSHPSLSRRTLLASVGLGGASAAGLLSGCSGDAGSTDPKLKPTIAPIELGPEVAGPIYPEGYVGPRATEKKPFHDGSKEFTVVVPQDAAVVGDWNKNKATDWFFKRTGLKVNFQSVLITAADGSTDLTKINAMLSGGDLPDAFMGIPFTNAQVSLYGQQGLFVPVDDLIAVYAPETRQMMKDYPDLRSLRASSDGKLYQIPGVNDCYHCRSGAGRAWINTGYLEKVGMPMPTTTDEFRQVMLEFKGRNPSGQSGFLPFAAGQTNPLDNYFMQSFLYSPPGSSTGGWLRLTDGKVEFTANLPEWREALKYLRQLKDDGIITPQAFSMTETEMQTAGNKNLLGFARAFWWGSFFNPVSLDPKAPWRNYQVVPPLKGPDGVQYSQWDHYGFATNSMQITNACSDPDLLVQWSDYQKDLTSLMWTYDGIQDENWFWADEGDTGINGKQALFRDVQWPAPVGQSWNQYATLYRSIDFRHGQKVDPNAPTYEAGLFQAGEAYEKFAEPKEMQLPPVIIGDDVASQVADTATAINQAVKQGMSQFTLGDKDVNNDADWKAYTDAFTAMKLPDYLDIYQKAYDTRPQ